MTDLNMSKYVVGYNSNSYVYDLYGICNQSGGVQVGHYNAFVKNSNDSWYHFNDAIISKVDKLNNLISSNAYCLFYRKKNLN